MNNSAIRNVGKKGEELAERFLLNNGHEILTKNYRSRFGEIDIVSFKDNMYYFNEVKTVKFSEFHPFEQITERKLRKIIKTGLIYMNSRGRKGFDYSVSAIGITLNGNGTYKIYYEKHVTI